MPELPEVETTLRGIAPFVVGNSVKQFKIRNGNLRWPVEESLPRKLKNKPVISLARRGKYLVFEFSNGHLLWHLGMSGNLRILQSSSTPQKHDHIDVTFVDGYILRYQDPRRFGAVVWTTDAVADHKLINHLGPEPLTSEFCADYLYQKSRKRSQAIKSWIMDSKVVVGVGNIYANEALFKAKIHPLMQAGKLSRTASEILVEEIKTVLSKAIQQGGTTLKDFVGGDGKPGYFAQALQVYGRGGEPCPSCSKPLTEKHIAQRSTVYCTHCQKR